MRCTRLLGHKWTKWCKKLGAPKKDGLGNSVQSILLTRRCALCGYIEEVWTNSCYILKDAPDEKEDLK